MSSKASRRGARVPQNVTPNATPADRKAEDVTTGKTCAGPVLAVDYGRKRIGLAISDELGLTASPLRTIHRENRRKDLRQLREICHARAVRHVIVGHPLHLSGETGEMALEAEAFAKRLARAVGLTVELVDERLTSWEARQTMARTKPGARPARRPLDDIAAAVLLRDYLERKGSGHFNVTETD